MERRRAYGAKILNLSRDLCSNVIRHTFEVEDELRESLSIVPLPLTNALETVCSSLYRLLRRWRLPGSSKFPLKGSRRGIARLLQEQLCILLLLSQGLTDQGTRLLVLIVVEIEDLFFKRRLAGVTRVLGSRALARDGVDGTEGRVDGI